jgi:protein O-GlcNAc transferase
MTSAALLEKAQRAHQGGDARSALALLERLLKEQPDHPQANLHYALLLAGEGRLESAATTLEQLAERHPNVPAVVINLGEVQRRLGRYEAAIKTLQRAVALAPDMPTARFNLALSLRGAGRLDEALAEYAEALRQQPAHGDGWYNQGNAQLEAGLDEDAKASYQQALKLLPPDRHPRVLNNLGSALIMQRRSGEAENSLKQAVQLAPDYAEAQLNLAVSQERQGRLTEAAAGFRRTAVLRPDHWWQSLRADCLVPDVFDAGSAIDDWRETFATTIEQWRGRPGKLDLASLHVSGAEPPTTLMYQGRDDLRLKTAYADMLLPRLPAFEPPKARRGLNRPRIGFVVNHGHEGIFARSVRGVLEQLDLSRYEIVLAVTRPAFRRAQKLLPIEGLQWLALSQRVDQAAEQLRSAGLDLLYHWEVGSDSFNYFLPWFRSAPVQYTSWAWPTTTGIPCMNYFLSSDLVEQAGAQSRYRESLLTMPGNMFTWAEPPVLPSHPLCRSDFGFGEAEHLYLCHQNPRKIHPDFDALAADILERDPLGRLLLIGSVEGAETEPLRARLERKLGSMAERVQLLPRMATERYLGLLNCVDVALDPPHYSGANTSYDALGLGLPVVTLASPLLRGNFTTGLYRRMGLAGLSAESHSEYVELALGLGCDPALRGYWHEQLQRESPQLFHDAHAVTELESAWWCMLSVP